MIYFIPTPIGNMGDITIRGQQLLLNLDYIIVENFSTASLLLKKLGRETMPKIVSFVKNEHFNQFQIENILQLGVDVGVISEAGMPSISDPGYLLTQYIQKNKYPYTVLPGACSIDTAVVASGLVNKGFVFLGFVPTKKGRETFFKEAITYTMPIVFLESVHRIDKCLINITQTFGPDDQVFIARELTKIYEEYILVTVSQLTNLKITMKGEFVIVIRRRELD
jgi:16S rRNA (cytidine1402-2'-O)-methyltransferase